MAGTARARTSRRLALGLALSLLAFGAEAATGRLFVFGDSYSAGHRRPFPNWAEQLRNDRAIKSLYDYAISGATASSSSGKTFYQQVNRWRQAARPFKPGDVTVIYLGYNDIDSFTSYVGSRNGYRAGLRALIDGGATTVGRRIVLVVPHDWGSTPQYASSAAARDDFRSKTILWDKFVRSIAGEYANVVAVDLFGLLDRVLAEPAAYGFTNVTTADPTNSAGTALYDDQAHFGLHGQTLIREAIQPFVE